MSDGEVMPAAKARKYDLDNDEFRVATHETFARMRAQDRVFLQPGVDGETMLWLVSRNDDVAAVLLDDGSLVPDPALV